MSTNANSASNVSKPITIDTANASSPRGRSRSASLLSNASSLSSMPGLSPTSSRGSPPRNASAILPPAFSFSRGANGSPTTPAATSPLTAYFLSGTSPSKGNNPFFPNTFAPTIVDEDPAENEQPPMHGHHRRMSNSWIQGPNRFGPSGAHPGSAGDHERGAGVLRRLSLGAAFTTRPSAATLPSRRPPTPPAVEPSGRNSPPRAGTRAKRRTATISEAPKKRSVSPMGERMLKGHFDGFGL